MLRNGKFDGGTDGTQQRYVWQDGKPVAYPETYDNIRVPSYWTLSYIEGMPGPGAPENVTGRPEADVIYLPTAPDPKRFLPGIPHTFKAFTFWRNHLIYLHQTVSISAYNELRAWVHHHSWYSRCSTEPHVHEPLDDDCTTAINWASQFVRIGIDPTGGKSPFGSNIQWGGQHEIYGEYDYEIDSPILQLDHAAYVTVFIESVTTHPLKHNDLYLSNAVLEVEPFGPGPGDECLERARMNYARTVNVYDPEFGRTAYLDVCQQVWDEYGPQTVSPSTDDAFVGCGLGSKTGRWWHVGDKEWPDYLDFAQAYYPNTSITMLHEGGTPPSPSPPPELNFEPISLHLQTEVDGWVQYCERLHAAGRPVKWVKFVMGAEASRKIEHCTYGALYRHFIGDDYGYMLAADPKDAANWYLDKFWKLGPPDNPVGTSAIARNPHIKAVEGTNELFGTSNTTQELQTRVALEIAISNEVARRSAILFDATGRDVICVGGNVPIGNLQHGAQTALLAPLIDVLIANGHGMGYHPYFPITNSLEVSRKWMLEEGYHHHLRAQTSWLESIPQLADCPLFYNEGGGIACHVRADGRPGDYQASNGWRDSNGLGGNFDWYLELLLLMRKLMLEAPLGKNIECYNIFTQSTFNDQWMTFKLYENELNLLSAALAAL